MRIVANICGGDIRSVTGSNLYNIKKLVNLDPTTDGIANLKRQILDIRAAVPLQDFWRVPCLQKFLGEKYALVAKHQDTEDIDKLISSICIS